MKFLCLCHYDRVKFAAMKPADFEKLGAACKPHDAELYSTGQVPWVSSLGMPDASMTIVAEPDGSHYVRKGPYADIAEPFGAVFMVDAADIGEAVRIAAKHPGAHIGGMMGGGIEVRAIEYYDEPGRKP